jgi:hypothetical protein
MMPIEGSTEDQMKTSLFAQLMSVVLTRRVMVMIRYMDAKHTLVMSVKTMEVFVYPRFVPTEGPMMWMLCRVDLQTSEQED